MRSMNTAAVRRANAQLYRAVRMFPTCRSPLGDGAKRTLTAAPPSACPGSAGSVTGTHLARQRSDVLDRHGDLVADLQGPGPRGRPREQHIARHQRHDLADESDQRGHVVAQLRGSRPLPDRAIDASRQGQIGGGGLRLDPPPHRAEGVQPPPPPPPTPPFLPPPPRSTLPPPPPPTH